METSRLIESSPRPAHASTFDTPGATDNLTEFLRARCAEIELEETRETISGRHSDWSVRHPWLRNLLYFGPSLGAIAGGVIRAAIEPGEPLVYCGLIAAGTLWGVGSCIHLRADKYHADAHYGGEFRYC